MKTAGSSLRLRTPAARPKTLAGYWVPESLRALVASRANAPVNTLPNEEIVDCVNGRWPLPDPRFDLGDGEAVVEDSTGNVVVARLRRADAEYFLTTGELHERVDFTERLLTQGSAEEPPPERERDSMSVQIVDTAVKAAEVFTKAIKHHTKKSSDG